MQICKNTFWKARTCSFSHINYSPVEFQFESVCVVTQRWQRVNCFCMDPILVDHSKVDIVASSGWIESEKSLMCSILSWKNIIVQTWRFCSFPPNKFRICCVGRCLHRQSRQCTRSAYRQCRSSSTVPRRIRWKNMVCSIYLWFIFIQFIHRYSL